MNEEHSNEQYLPNLILNFVLPKGVPIFIGISVFIIFVGYISTPNGRSMGSITITAVLSAVFGSIAWLSLYLYAKDASAFIVVNNGVLYLKKGNDVIKEINLDSFSSFLVERTVSLEASGDFIKIELFVVDENNSKQKLFQNDFGNSLTNSWEKFLPKLKQMTGKDFKFDQFVVGLDGKKHELEEFKKNQWKTRVPLFKNPFK